MAKKTTIKSKTKGPSSSAAASASPSYAAVAATVTDKHNPDIDQSQQNKENSVTPSATTDGVPAHPVASAETSSPTSTAAKVVVIADTESSTAHSYMHARDNNDARIDQSQEAWSSLQQEREEDHSHQHSIHHDVSETTTNSNAALHDYLNDNGDGDGDGDGDDEDQIPVERAAPRRYEDDDEDNNHHGTEQVPLIRTSSRDSITYHDGEDSASRGRRPGRATARGSANRDADGEQPRTRLQWAIENGLHPRTYIDGHKRIGAVLFVLSYTAACTLFLPGSLFTIGAGFLFKPFPLALLIVLLGDIFAAVWSFVFGRYVFYDWVKNMMSRHPKFSALDQVIKDDGWKIVVMLRLTPVPFSLITYFFSITSIRLWTVIWATCVGVLPGSCIGIWIGSLLKGLSGIDNPELENKNVVILVMNGVFIVCCILSLSLFGKRSLRKAMKRLDQHQALTSLHEVEVVVEGVATVVRELEDTASIPPSFRSTMVEQLAAEEEARTNPSFYREDDVEAAQQGLLRNESSNRHSSATSTTMASQISGSGIKAPLASSGFTRGEKITFVVIAVVAVLNVCVCVPLYYHFANQDDDKSGIVLLSE
ncbi:hypothetical protein EDD11_008699 [Mortierella claussenii]|nr:hypothetical protein EDD11_008699 [Mortierella claussenii]